MNEDNIFDGEKLREFFRKNTGYIMLLFIALIYVATSLLQISETGKSVLKIVGDGALCFVVGVVFTSGFSLQGIVKGNEDSRVKEAREAHGEQVLRIEPYADALDDWCDFKTAQALRRERTKILASCSMRYDDYFDERGIAKPFVCAECKTKKDSEREKARFDCYTKALKCKITPLSASVLTGGKGKVGDPFNFGADIDEYELGILIKDAISKVLIGLIFGYYTVSMLAGISVADLIWKIFQVCMFCASGYFQSQKAYFFMTNDYCKRLALLTGKLKEFEVSQNKNEEVTDGEAV